VNDLPLQPVQQLAKESLNWQILNLSTVEGKISLPAVPGMIDEYTTLCVDLFAGVGRRFSTEEVAHLRSVLEGQLAAAHSTSPCSNIVISYNASGGPTLHYRVDTQCWTLEANYEWWISAREPPLFGPEPDALVWALANEATDPGTHRILDIGAGTGRNTLPLARRGHPVDVVELTPKFAQQIESTAQQESLDVRVIVRDVFATKDDLRQDYRLILLSGVVTDFGTTQRLRDLFELAAQCLAPGGRLVFNTFLPRGGYVPDDAARQFGQKVYTTIFTRDEMDAAKAGLPLELIADDSVYDYEKEHLPEGAWPPTSWYFNWVNGLGAFPVDREKSPIELRWLVYQKTGCA
jgi:SAM-dependent methyltransferase